MISVSLVAATQPSPPLMQEYNIQTMQEFVAFVARVSNPSNQHNTLTSGKLIRFLWENKHFSPFEMAHYVLEINTTRDIARQILRHRSFSFQEWSQRYSDVTKLSLEPEIREARLQDKKNRQNSFDTDDAALQEWWRISQLRVWEESLASYKAALEQGIAKEVARSVLPEGLTPSRLYMAGSVRSWLHYVSVRSDSSTQKEHREIAIQAARIISDWGFPIFKEFFPDLFTNPEN